MHPLRPPAAQTTRSCQLTLLPRGQQTCKENVPKSAALLLLWLKSQATPVGYKRQPMQDQIHIGRQISRTRSAAGSAMPQLAQGPGQHNIVWHRMGNSMTLLQSVVRGTQMPLSTDRRSGLHGAVDGMSRPRRCQALTAAQHRAAEAGVKLPIKGRSHSLRLPSPQGLLNTPQGALLKPNCP